MNCSTSRRRGSTPTGTTPLLPLPRDPLLFVVFTRGSPGHGGVFCLSHAQKDTDHTMNNGRKKKIRKECDRRNRLALCHRPAVLRGWVQRRWERVAWVGPPLLTPFLITPGDAYSVFPPFLIWTRFLINKTQITVIKNTYSPIFFFFGYGILEMSEFRLNPFIRSVFFLSPEKKSQVRLAPFLP